MDAVAHQTKTGLLRRFLSALGPGVTAGAADDDPSGIGIYSIVGAQLGTSLLWTAASLGRDLASDSPLVTTRPSDWRSR
jgi:Mn2+/Fe2+ NRAMP family transporter